MICGFFIENKTGSTKNFNLFCCYDRSGLPVIDEPVYALENQEIPVTMGEWISISLPGIEISTPSFWIVIEWLTKPLSSERGRNSFFLGTDKTLDYPLRNLWHFDNWQKTPTVIGDFLVNVKVKE